MRDRICTDAFPSDPFFDGLSIFANNYTAQGVKIKGCKSVLTRVYSFMTFLEPQELHACQFVKRQADGIHVIDMSFVPEKYRLDVRRAESIVNRSLTNWADRIE